MTTNLPVQALVRAFHDRYGFPAADQPTVPSPEQSELRIALIKEEWREFTDAARNRDLVKVADALADLIYVTYGAAVVYGIDLDAVVAEVHRSNLTKDGSVGGKARKGPGYEPPRIAAVLAAQRGGAT